jgi:hypothetical protein
MSNRRILKLLNDAEAALRENLHRHDLYPTARDHMEQALSHTREAYVATNEIGKARTVQQLIDDSAKVDRLIQRLRRHKSAEPVAKPIRV